MGVHYPSDCLGGILLGFIVVGIGEIFNRDISILGCPSCLANNCYSLVENEAFHFVHFFFLAFLWFYLFFFFLDKSWNHNFSFLFFIGDTLRFQLASIEILGEIISYFRRLFRLLHSHSHPHMSKCI